MYDLEGKNILFIAFHYPPEGGSGLPGSMRTVKFVRNFKNTNISVLTKKCHKSFVDAEITLPVAGEKIYRSGFLDIFALIMRLRVVLKKILRPSSSIVEHQENHTSVFATSVSGSGASENRSTMQRVKDFIHDLCYFPDQAGPWVLPAFFDGLKVIRKEKIQLIFATGMPWSGLVVGWLLHLVTRKPLIADFRDPWMGNPFHKSKGRFLDFCSKVLERRIVKGASLVTLNTAPLREEFVSRYADIPENHFITLPNGYDLEDFKFFDSLQSCNTENDDLVLCHAGFLYGLRDPSPILDSIRIVNAELSDESPKIVFKQIGKVSLGYDVTEKFSDLIENGSLMISPERSYRDCLVELAKSDVLVNVQPGTRTQIPSKLYDYLALNRPILSLTPLNGALAEVVGEYEFGELFDGKEKQEIITYLDCMRKLKLTKKITADYPRRKVFNIQMITEVLGKKITEIC